MSGVEDPRLSAAIKKHATYHQAPDLLRKRVERSVRTAGKSPGRLSGWRPLMGAVAASVVLSLTLSTLIVHHVQGDKLEAHILASHVRSLQVDHLTDVASSDQHTVKPWFAGKIDFSPPVRDLREQGFPLEGGRLDYLDGRTVAALVYKRHQHVINVFVWPDSASAAEHLGSRDGFNVLHWSDDGFAYWAVSDLNATELREFAQLLKAPAS
jgi:anti-sigma factor RsiW